MLNQLGVIIPEDLRSMRNNVHIRVKSRIPGAPLVASLAKLLWSSFFQNVAFYSFELRSLCCFWQKEMKAESKVGERSTREISGKRDFDIWTRILIKENITPEIKNEELNYFFPFVWN